MDAQQRVRLILLLDTLQKQLGCLQTECTATRTRLDSLRSQYTKQTLLSPLPPAHGATLKKKCSKL